MQHPSKGTCYENYYCCSNLFRTELEQAQIEIEQLRHKLKMLEMENRLLKKLEEIERRGR